MEKELLKIHQKKEWLKIYQKVIIIYIITLHLINNPD